MRAGIFQCAGGGLTPEARIGRLSDVLSDADLDLVVCPELFVSGYDVGDDIRSYAEPCGGPLSEQLAELAKSTATAIVFGYPERDGTNIYNAAACLDSGGHMLANHRKLLPPPGFESDYFTPGDGLTLFELNGVRCALLICYDAEFPEAVRAVAEAGAQVILVPTALAENWGSVALQMMPTRAFENGVWMLYANHAGREGETRYFGGSCIVAPDGKDAARAGSAEQLIDAELDLQRVVDAQERLPYIRHVQELRDKL